jgi:hypothetical protein
MAEIGREIVNQSNRIGVEFLFTDLRTAFTFLDVAKVTQVAESRERNRANAVKVYRTVLRLKPKLQLPKEDEARFEEQVAQLKRDLEEVGYSPESE